MSLLDRIWNTSIDLIYFKPRVDLKIDGFEFSVVRKDGVLLTSRPKDDISTEPKPASADFYYEASVRPTGENPEYPERETASTFQFTYGLDGNMSRGMLGGIGYIPHNHKFLKFQLVEEFYKSGQNMGYVLPNHHSVYLRAHFRDECGRITSMGYGMWSRKSEQQLLDNYRGCPIMMI